MFIPLSNCTKFEEDPAVCFGSGEPAGQCVYCGYKWFEHKLEALPEEEKESAARIQKAYEE